MTEKEYERTGVVAGDTIAATDFYEQRLVQDIALSPDGNRLAYVLREVDTDNRWHHSIYVVPTTGNATPRRVTRGSHAKAPRWGPDGNRLAFVSGRDSDAALDRRADSTSPGEGQQVWLLDLELGGEARQVTTLDRGVRAFDWVPDGESLVVEAPDPDAETREDGDPVEVEQFRHHHRTLGRSTARRYLFVVDVTTREHRRLEKAHTGGAWEPYTSMAPSVHPDGDRVAFVSDPGRTDHQFVLDAYTVDLETGERTQVTDAGRTIERAFWSPDGERLALRSRTPENRAEPARLSVVGPEGYEWPLTADLDRRVEAAVWERSDALLALIADEGRTRLARVNVDGGVTFLEWGLDETETLSNGGYEPVRRLDVAEKVVVACPSAPDSIRDVHATSVFNLAGADGPDPTPLTRTNAALEREADHPACERITFEGDDGATLEGFLRYPPGETIESLHDRPLHVRIHAGLEQYHEPAFRFEDSFLIGKGYVTFHPLERGSASFGQAHAERGQPWNETPVADILAGVDDLADRGIADPDRLFLSGYSRGANVGAFLLTESDRFAAAALERGIYDFYSAYGACAVQNWHEHHIGLPWEEPEANRAMSPITDVESITTPTMVTACGRDEWVPPRQAQMLYSRLHRLGVPTKLVTYPEENHALIDPENIVHDLRTRAEWFSRHGGPD